MTEELFYLKWNTMLDALLKCDDPHDDVTHWLFGGSYG